MDTIVMSQEDIDELQRLLAVRDQLQEEWRDMLDRVRQNNAAQKAIVDKYLPHGK